MANKNRKAQLQQANQQKAKQKQYDAATKNMFIFPIIALVVSVLVLLLYFVTFAGLYNAQAPEGNEGLIKGWTFVSAALTGNYTSTELAGGKLAVPFYAFAPEWCETIGVVALFAAVLFIVNVILQVFTIVRKMNVLNIVSAVIGLVASVLLIVCYATAVDLVNSPILPDYCNNNPACSFGSYSIIPAIVALGGTAASVVASVKHIKASALLK